MPLGFSPPPPLPEVSLSIKGCACLTESAPSSCALLCLSSPNSWTAFFVPVPAPENPESSPMPSSNTLSRTLGWCGGTRSTTTNISWIASPKRVSKASPSGGGPLAISIDRRLPTEGLWAMWWFDGRSERGPKRARGRGEPREPQAPSEGKSGIFTWRVGEIVYSRRPVVLLEHLIHVIKRKIWCRKLCFLAP